MLNRLLQHPLLLEKPPVLLDLGASGEVHPKWRLFHKYAVYIGFDADDRKMEQVEKENSSFKRFILFNRIVTDKADAVTDFYLTASPYCSSALEPDLTALAPWAFQSKFEVKEVVKLGAITLSKALADKNIDYIDWMKTDTQGTDLRLYLSIPAAIREKMLIAEFEPGILDAYKGEDKLFKILEHMNQSEFWMSGLEIKGNMRINGAHFSGLSKLRQRILRFTHIQSPGWGEMMFTNKMLHAKLEKRDFLLACVFALTEKQYGFALEISEIALQRYQDDIFADFKKYVLAKLNRNSWNLPLAGWRFLIRKLDF